MLEKKQSAGDPVLIIIKISNELFFSLLVFTKILFKKEVVPLSNTSINNRASSLDGHVNMLIWHEF